MILTTGDKNGIKDEGKGTKVPMKSRLKKEREWEKEES